MKQITWELGNFISALKSDHIPLQALEAARIGLIDCLAVMVAGARQEAPRMIAATVQTFDGSDFAREAVSGRKLLPKDAALVNGVAAHVLDYDDVALSAHPSAVLVPTVLAAGASEGSSGLDALVAYTVGYEVWAQLLALEPGQLHDRGFHPTGVLGAVAAAAAASRLYGLNVTQATNALAIACSLAAGLVCNFGTMTKSLHVGRAAQAGVLSAQLARGGFTGAVDAIENGFLAAHTPSGEPNLDPELDIGKNWRLESIGVNIKRYPTCYCTHRAIDAMLAIVEEHDILPEQVAQILVYTGGTQHRMLRHSRPQTELEAKFSMEFAMASALIARCVAPSQLTEQFIQRNDVQAQFEKISITTTEDQMEGGADGSFAPFDIVEVITTSGNKLTHPPVTHARGNWRRCLTDDELRAKFDACVAPTLGGETAARLWGQARNPAALHSVADLSFYNL